MTQPTINQRSFILPQLAQLDGVPRPSFHEWSPLPPKTIVYQTTPTNFPIHIPAGQYNWIRLAVVGSGGLNSGQTGGGGGGCASFGWVEGWEYLQLRSLDLLFTGGTTNSVTFTFNGTLWTLTATGGSAPTPGVGSGGTGNFTGGASSSGSGYAWGGGGAAGPTGNGGNGNADQFGLPGINTGGGGGISNGSTTASGGGGVMAQGGPLAASFEPADPALVYWGSPGQYSITSSATNGGNWGGGCGGSNGGVTATPGAGGLRIDLC